MGKNLKIIIFSLIAIAVLGGVAAVLMLTAPEETEKPESDEFAKPATASDNAELNLCSRSEDEVSRIEVTNRSGGFTILPSGETGADGNRVWSVEGLDNVPIDSSTLSTAVGYACSVSAKEFAETVSEASELAKYGLDDPDVTVNTTFTDGTGFSFSLGDSAPNSTTTVYMTTDGKNVYTAYTSRSNPFYGDKLGFVSREATPAYDQSSTEEVMKLVIERKDLEKPIEIDYIPEADEGDMQVFAYRMTSPYSSYIDLLEGSKFVFSSFGLNAAYVFDVDAADEELEKIGLDDPNCTIFTETNTREFTVKLSDPVYAAVTGDDGVEREVLQGYYGVSTEHPGIVYFFSDGTVSAVTKEPASVLSKLFLMPYIRALSSVSYSDSEGRNVEIGIEFISAASEEDEDIENYTVNGEKWNTQQVKNLYQYFISAAGEELYLDSGKGDLIAEIVYVYKDKARGVDGRDTVRFYSSNTDRKVIINVNGENIFKTRQMYATQLLANVTSFLNGGEIVSTY